MVQADKLIAGQKGCNEVGGWGVKQKRGYGMNNEHKTHSENVIRKTNAAEPS